MIRIFGFAYFGCFGLLVLVRFVVFAYMRCFALLLINICCFALL